jgi:hypothetical protein
MTRRRVLVALMFAGMLGGAASPALADDQGSRVCVNATHDKNNPGPAIFCVRLPVDRSQN